MEDVLIPIALFGSIFGIVAVLTYFRFRTQRELQETVRTLLQSGQQVSEEKLSELGSALSPREQDLRRGMISVAIAIAVGILAVLLDESDAVGPLLGVSACPLLIGLAYLLLYQLGKKQQGGKQVA